MRRILVLILTIFLLAACTAARQPTEEPSPTAKPAPTAAPLPTSSPLSPSTSLDLASAAPLIAEAAKLLGIPTDQISLVSIEPMEWSDGCLGLAGAGEMCTMAITPGYLVTLNTPKGQIYFHTNQTLNYFRMVPFTAEVLDADTLVKWNRTGGIAGVCEELTISRQGMYVLTDCRGSATPLSGKLPDADWQYLQKQVAQFASFEWKFEPPAGSADMFLDSFSLQGTGSLTPGLPAQEGFNTWLAELARRLSLMTPASGRDGGLITGQSGINLITMLGPTCGGPVKANDPNCADQPYAAVIDILDNTGAVLSTVQTDNTGKTSISLPAGTYTLQPQNAGRFPVAQPQTVTVPVTSFIEVTILYESGLR